MSGKCEKGGDHALESECEPLCQPQQNGRGLNDKFFYKGKFFQNEDEFWKYAEEWPFMITDQETFFREWEHLGKEIWMNVGLPQVEITNGALNEILEEGFIYLLQKFLNKNHTK